MSDDCFNAYNKFIPIEILGRPARVPEKNTLLRCFQYLCPETVPQGKFCWNNECGNSSFRYRLPGEPQERQARACCFTRISDGLEIVAISDELRHVPAGFFEAVEPGRAVELAGAAQDEG